MTDNQQNPVINLITADIRGNARPDGSPTSDCKRLTIPAWYLQSSKLLDFKSIPQPGAHATLVQGPFDPQSW
ncbi:hypothetical protein ACPOL_2256 [Acidisarcina polymorpha]|uniref:Uncharacterized protein n=1 Tax=Acidisarcina polymorpha TaxID=2211140 RepID=A0A2Z5FXX7_9BACT|nr:hypothetical protein ACPOL_2256 [Acidisarcina polymorpha]